MNKKRAKELFKEMVEQYEQTDYYRFFPIKKKYELDEFVEYIQKKVK